MLFTLVIAFNVFGPNPISDLLQQVIAHIPRIIVAIVIIVVASAIAKVVKDLISNTLGGLSYGNVLATIASVFIMFLGVVAALNQVGVATAVTTPVLVTILATIGGVIVVGAGGGLILPGAGAEPSDDRRTGSALRLRPAAHHRDVGHEAHPAAG